MSHSGNMGFRLGFLWQFIGLCSISFGLLSLVSVWLSTWHWVFDFIAYFLLFGFWATIIGALFFWLGKAWRLACLALVTAFLIAFSASGPIDLRFFHKKEAPNERMLKVYQHNVFASNAMKSKLSDGILQHAADLVVLLEADKKRFAEYLRPLESVYPYQIADTNPLSWVTRIQIYAKSPIERKLIKRTRSGAALFVGNLKHAEHNVTLVVVHLARPWPFDDPNRQLQQIDEIVEAVTGIKGPVLVMGDFNAPPWGRIARRLNLGLDLRVFSPGLRATWPVIKGSPKLGEILPAALGIPIDLLFTSKDVSVSDWQLRPALGSDHRALTYALAFKETSE